MNAKLQERAIAVAVAAMAVLCSLALVHIAQVVPLHIPLDPNEGWNAYHAEAAMRGQGLYPPRAGMMINNYPPLFFYVDGALGRVVGDDIVAGRILSLLAAAASALGIALAVTRMKGGRIEAGFAALFFLALLLLQSDYVGMSDPQLVGHALQIAALVIAFKVPRTIPTLAIVALLLSTAFFFKHNLVLLPLALTIWLVMVDRSNAVKLAAFGIAFLGAGLFVFKLAYGIGLLEQLHTARGYSLAPLKNNLLSWLAISGAPLFAAVACLTTMRRGAFAVFCMIYLAISVIAGAIFLGGAGVDVNAMFDAFIALALSAGLVLERLRTASVRALVAGAFALPLVVAFAVSFDAEWLTPGYWIHPMAMERRAAAVDIDFLRKHSGPAMCEMLSLCFWAGKSAEVDVFNLGQQYATHARSDSDLIGLLEQRHFAAVQLDPFEPFPLTSRVQDVFASNYKIDHRNEADGAFYVPR